MLTIAWAGVHPRASHHVTSSAPPRTNRTSPFVAVAVADPVADPQLAYWRPTTAAPGRPVARRTAPCAAASPAAPSPATSTAGPGARGPAGGGRAMPTLWELLGDAWVGRWWHRPAWMVV